MRLTTILTALLLILSFQSQATPVRIDLHGIVTDAWYTDGEDIRPVEEGDILTGWYQYDWDAVSSYEAGGSIIEGLIEYSINAGSVNITGYRSLNGIKSGVGPTSLEIEDESSKTSFLNGIVYDSTYSFDIFILQLLLPVKPQ